MATKPLFKYIGGKTKFATDISSVIKSKHTNYCEPFCGALGAFLGIEEILYSAGVRNITLNDINSSIIEIYSKINTDPEDFIRQYSNIENMFSATCPTDPTDSKNKEKLVGAQEFYNKIRTEFNKKKISGDTSRYIEFLFLQKHAFNGVYRENSKGEHNVPFNWNGTKFDHSSFATHVRDINTVFKKYSITFSSNSVFDMTFSEDVLYYLDPPYYNDSSTENKYNKDDFDIAAQEKLINCIKDMSFIYSNHNSKFILSKFNNDVSKKVLNRKNIMAGSGGNKSDSVQEILIWSNV